MGTCGRHADVLDHNCSGLNTNWYSKYEKNVYLLVIHIWYNLAKVFLIPILLVDLSLEFQPFTSVAAHGEGSL